MTPIHLFSLASQYNKWLTVRQSAVASNIANANTPGFKAQDVQPFESVLDQANLAMASTQPGHVSYAPASVPTTEVRADDAWEVSHSGNTVSLEKEMLKAGEVNRAFSLNTSVLKAFHRMLLTSAKS
ncbi:MAG: flagellar basal body rod protein FlgB [Hyphomicrobiaceae bacterium]|jgi:flagellar basal-body rod protein FlgB